MRDSTLQDVLLLVIIFAAALFLIYAVAALFVTLDCNSVEATTGLPTKMVFASCYVAPDGENFIPVDRWFPYGAGQ